MKRLEISEADTQPVIKVAGSTMARIVPKDDPKAVHAMLIEILAEAPEEKEDEPEPEAEPKTVLQEAAAALDGDEMGLEETARAALEAVGEVLRSPEAQKAKSFFEKAFPMTRSQREAKKKRESSG